MDLHLTPWEWTCGLVILTRPNRGGLVFKAHRFFVSLNSRIERNKEEEKITPRETEVGVGSGGGRERLRCKETPASRLWVAGFRV